MAKKKSWPKSQEDAVRAKFDELEGKPQSVAFVVWSYDANPDITGAEIRAIGADVGIKVAGRAIGSGREIVNGPDTKVEVLPPLQKGDLPRKKTRSAGVKLDAIGMAFETLRDMEQRCRRYRKAMEDISHEIDLALGGGK